MYQDTCQKKKSKQISSKKQEGNRPRESKARQGTEKETNPSLLEGCNGRPNGVGNKGYFAHEYVIFYRRGNYLIEGETSPINRSLISSQFIHPSLRDLRDSLSRTCGRKSSLSL